MGRARLGWMALAATLLPVVAGACGSSGTTAGATMPPLITTTTTSTTVYVSTTAAQVTTYVVQAGDTLSKIAGRFGVKAADIMALNGITRPDHIEKGQKLKIPPPSADTATTAKAATTSSGG